VSPTLLVFAETAVGQTSVQLLHIGNVGDADLDVTEIVVETGLAQVFTVTPSSVVVAVDDIVEIRVTFAPDSPGDYQARLFIRFDDEDERQLEILMNAAAIP
jgi:hypothetical protein